MRDLHRARQRASSSTRITASARFQDEAALPRAHGRLPDIGRGECGRIVDAVADHHGRAVPPRVADEVTLRLGSGSERTSSTPSASPTRRRAALGSSPGKNDPVDPGPAQIRSTCRGHRREWHPQGGCTSQGTIDGDGDRGAPAAPVGHARIAVRAGMNLLSLPTTTHSHHYSSDACARHQRADFSCITGMV